MMPIPRNFSITLRLTLYFSIAMTLVLYSVSGLVVNDWRKRVTAR